MHDVCPHISLEGKLPNGIQSAVFDATCVFLEHERKREVISNVVLFSLVKKVDVDINTHNKICS